MFVYDHTIGTTMHMLSLNYLYFYFLMNKTIYFISFELLGAVNQGYNNPRSFTSTMALNESVTHHTY